MTFSRPRTTRILQFRPAIFGLLAITVSGLTPALAQGEDEVFHYLIPLAEAVNLSESGLHEQVIGKTKKLLADLDSKKGTALKSRELSERNQSITSRQSTALSPLPVLRGDTNCGDVYRQLQAEALALKGLSNFTLKRTSQAISDLKQATVLCPEHAYVLSELGTVYVKSKKPKEGIAVLTRAIKLNQNIREAYFMRASGYQQIGKLKEAQSDWARAQKLYTDQQKNIDSLSAKIDKLVQENKIAEAIDLDRQLLQVAPRDGLAVTGYADHLTSSGKDKEALNYVSTAIALDPSNGYPYRVRSVINSHLQNPDAELRDANIAFAIEPRSAEALNSRAIANLDADQPVQAIRDFDLLIKRKPEFADAYINRSTAYLRIGAFEKAIKDAKRAVALAPASPYGYQCLGAALRRGGNLKEAREALEVSLRYTKIASTDSVAMAQFNLGAVFLALKDPKGNEHIDTAIKLAPNLPAVFLQRGAYNASLGKIDEAIKILTRKPARSRNSTSLSKLAGTNPPTPKPNRLVVTNDVVQKLNGSRKKDLSTTPSAFSKDDFIKQIHSQKPIARKKSATTVGTAKPSPSAHKIAAPTPITRTTSSITPAKTGSAPLPIFRKIQVSTVDLQDCLLAANRVIENTPGKPETYYTRGLANLCLKNYDQAISDFRKLTNLTKNEIRRQRALVLAYLCLERIGKINEANNCLKLAVEKSTSTTSGGKTESISSAIPELKYFRNELAEPALFAGKLTTKDLTRVHSYLGFHFNSLTDKTKANTHVRWVLDRGDVSSPELVLTATDEKPKRVPVATP